MKSVRNDLQIIQSVISDISYDSPELLPSNSIGEFKFYRIVLPNRYKGLFPVWYFAIFNDNGRIVDSNDIIKIKGDAAKLIKNAIEEKLTPLILISDHTDIVFSNYFEYRDREIFFISKNDIPGRNNFLNNLKNAPFIRAVRNKYNISQLPETLFTLPYQPNKPVRGWRFFGRKKEIEQIITNSSNFFVLGPRRIGKTSLLQEVEKRLTELGHKVYMIPVQDCINQGQIIAAIASKLSPKEVVRARQHTDTLGANFLTTLIRRLKGKHQKFVLILDELGNVITKNDKDDWKIMGVLRELSHSGEIKVIISAFQEVLIKQYDEFEGPFVNFGSILKLNTFSHTETEEFLLEPLGIWGQIDDKNDILNLIISNFGTHPFILQYLGDYLFREIFKTGIEDVKTHIEELLENDDLQIFEGAVSETFFTLKNSILKYAFLVICRDEEQRGNENLFKAEITYEYLSKILEDVGIISSFDERRFLLGQLETHGLIRPEINNKLKYKISAPIIYTYLKKYYNPIEDLIKELKSDIIRNKELYTNARLI